MEQPRLAAQLAQLAIALAGVAAILWMETPAWQRQMMLRSIRARCRGLAGRAARASGRRAMGDELAGRQDDAEQGYRFTYRLSSLRDRI
jgi:hypothetical protein